MVGDPKMHPQTNIMNMIILEMRPGVKVTKTQKWYVTLHNPKMNGHAKYGIDSSNNIGDMLQIRCEGMDCQLVTDSVIIICPLLGHKKR